MSHGRSAGVLLLTMLAVLTSCGGTGRTLASRTAADGQANGQANGQATSVPAPTGSQEPDSEATVTASTPDSVGDAAAAVDTDTGTGVTTEATANPGTIEVVGTTADAVAREGTSGQPSASTATRAGSSEAGSSAAAGVDSATPTSTSSRAVTTGRTDPANTTAAAAVGGTATTRRAVATTARPASTTRRTTTSRSTPTTVTTRRATSTTASTTAVTTPPTAPLTTRSATGVLVFTRTAGFRHPSISDGVGALAELARSAGYRVTTSENPATFNDRDLADYAVVVFLSTSGDILNSDQQAAFQRYIEGGGGFVGIHAATDTEYGWPWYGRLVGTWFANHPLLPNDQFVDCHCFTASVIRQASHPSTDHLPAVWSHRDEWYNFRAPLPASARILLTVDESTYSGGTMGSVHPVTWTQQIGAGRSWYTALGHTPASYRDSNFRRHLLGGLRWAAG